MSDTLDRITQLVKSRQYAEGLQAAKEHLAAEADNQQALFLSGVCQYNLQNYQAADDTLRRVLLGNNQHYKARYYLALVLNRLSRTDEAITELKMCLAVKPDFEEARKKIVQWTSASIPRSEDVSSVSPEGELLVRARRRMSSFGGHMFTVMFLTLISILLLVGGAEEEMLAVAGLVAGGGALMFFVALVLRGRATHFVLYERRIDIITGVLSNSHVSVWTYQVEDIWMERSVVNRMTGNAKLFIRASGLKSNRKPTGLFLLTGLGDQDFMGRLFDEMRLAVLVERRKMKKWWI